MPKWKKYGKCKGMIELKYVKGNHPLAYVHYMAPEEIEGILHYGGWWIYQCGVHNAFESPYFEHRYQAKRWAERQCELL